MSTVLAASGSLTILSALVAVSCGFCTAPQYSIVGSATVLIASTSPPRSATPARPGSISKKSTAIRDAIALLIDEAKAIQLEQSLPRKTADFVARFEQDIPTADIVKAIITPCHKDRFIDAYVRWQLTSLNPDLPELNDAQMLALMAGAPPMIDNPRTNEEMIRTFERAEKTKKQSPGEMQRIKDAAADLELRTRAAEDLNVPAEQWREWIDSKLPSNGPRRLQWLVERAAATASAGWPVRGVKAQLTKQLKAAGLQSSEALSLKDRRLVEEHMRRLVGLKRRAINQITFLADGSLSVSFSNNAIDIDDVQKWSRLLEGNAVADAAQE